MVHECLQRVREGEKSRHVSGPERIRRKINMPSALATFRYPSGFIPEQDHAILSQVADQYGLAPEQRALLYAIRRQENGGPGREMGVLNSEAERYAGNHSKSLQTQAQWAAGTIKKRYDGDLVGFGKRWAPVGAKNDPKNLNKNWVPGVQKFMQQLYYPDGYGE